MSIALAGAQVRAWDPEEAAARPAAVAKLRGHGGRVTCLAVSRCGLHLASGAGDGAVLVWSTGSFEFVARFDVGGWRRTRRGPRAFVRFCRSRWSVRARAAGWVECFPPTISYSLGDVCFDDALSGTSL